MTGGPKANRTLSDDAMSFGARALIARLRGQRADHWINGSKGVRKERQNARQGAGGEPRGTAEWQEADL